MAKRRLSPRQKLVTQLKKEGYEKTTFPTEPEAYAFAEGINQAIVPWKTDADYEILPPTKHVKDWTVYYRVYSYDEDGDDF